MKKHNRNTQAAGSNIPVRNQRLAEWVSHHAKTISIPADDLATAIVLIQLPGFGRGQPEEKLARDLARETIHHGAKLGAYLAIGFALKNKWITKEQAAKAVVEGTIAAKQI